MRSSRTFGVRKVRVRDRRVIRCQGGRRAAPDGAQHLLGAAAEGQKADALLVEPVEMSIGGQLRVEDQFLGRVAGVLPPEVDEVQDFVRLRRLGEAGLGVAQHALRGVPGQKDQDPLLASASAGHVVLLQGFRLRIGRHGVKVQIDGRAAGHTASL